MATLSNGTDTIEPEQIDGFESDSESGTLVERVLGSEEVAVTLRPATLRNGRMSLVMGHSEAGSAAAESALRGAHVWTLTTGTRPTIDMSFVVVGRITRTLDPSTRNVWLVGFSWQEVNP